MTADWHTPDFPELRPAAPWVMEEMILEQRLLARDAGDLPGAAELADVITEAVSAGGDITVTGCGTSEHAAQAVAALIRASAPTAHVVARQALDVAEEPGTPAVVIGISHDGGTRATQLALEAAKDSATAAITARPNSAVAAAAATTVVTTPRLDRSWCHTLAYTSAIIAGAAAAGVSAGDITGAAAVLADDALIAEARAIGHSQLPASRIITTGMAVDLIAARELALKIEEGSRIAATAHHLETLLHGHLAACDATTRLVVFAADPTGDVRRTLRTALAIDAATAIGIPATVVLPADSKLAVPTGVSTIRIPVSGKASLLGMLLGEAIALQSLTLGMIDVAGWNPDLIRRESAPYRAAALAGDGGQW